jgi:hypothetical protein
MFATKHLSKQAFIYFGANLEPYLSVYTSLNKHVSFAINPHKPLISLIHDIYDEDPGIRDVSVYEGNIKYAKYGYLYIYIY